MSDADYYYDYGDLAGEDMRVDEEIKKAESQLDPITQEYLLNILGKLPNTTEDELRAAKFPEEVIQAWSKMWSRPPIGKVNLATQRAISSNTQLKLFFNETSLNEWFENNFGYVLYDWNVLENGRIYAFIGQTLSPEDQLDMEERASLISKQLEEKREERNRIRAAHMEKLKAQREEERRLMDLGRRCEHNHPKTKKGK